MVEPPVSLSSGSPKRAATAATALWGSSQSEAEGAPLALSGLVAMMAEGIQLAVSGLVAMVMAIPDVGDAHDATSNIGLKRPEET